MKNQNESWVATLDRQYQSAFASTLTNVEKGKLHQTDTVNVSGFDVDISNQEKTDELLQKMKKENIELESFRNSLKEKGLNPLGVVPKDILQEVIADLPFYTFKDINEKGEVKSHLENLKEKGLSNIFIILLASFASLVGYIVSAFAVSGWFILGVVMYIISFLTIINHCSSSNKDSDLPNITFVLFALGMPFLLLLDLYYDQRKSRYLKKDHKNILWPNKTDDSGRDWVKLVLPKPPNSFLKTLNICHQENIKTYLLIHEKGFTIDVKEVKAQYNDIYDPLLCTLDETSQFVAILDQFGDIPEEQKLIEKIQKKYMHLEKRLSLKAIEFLS